MGTRMIDISLVSNLLILVDIKASPLCNGNIG